MELRINRVRIKRSRPVSGSGIISRKTELPQIVSDSSIGINSHVEIGDCNIVRGLHLTVLNKEVWHPESVVP